MRWFKHLSMAHSDENLSEILESDGAEAYGIWWLILEDLAALMEKGSSHPSATHSVGKWSQICHCSARKFRSIASRLAEKNLIDSETINDRLRISVPKLVKYRDEYQKKSGHSPDNVPPRAETETETEEEEEKERRRVRMENENNPPPPPIEWNGIAELQAPTNRPARSNGAKAEDSQEWPISLKAARAIVPADRTIVGKIAAAARNVSPDISDSQLAWVLQKTAFRGQKKAGAWLTSVPDFLREGERLGEITQSGESPPAAPMDPAQQLDLLERWVAEFPNHPSANEDRRRIADLKRQLGIQDAIDKPDAGQRHNKQHAGSSPSKVQSISRGVAA